MRRQGVKRELIRRAGDEVAKALIFTGYWQRHIAD